MRSWRLTVRFPWSLLITMSRVAEHAGAPEGWRGRRHKAEARGLGSVGAFLSPAGMVSSSSGSPFTQGVAHLAAAAGGRAQGCPHCSSGQEHDVLHIRQQTGFLITCSSELATTNLQRGSGGRRHPGSSPTASSGSGTRSRVGVALDFHRTPLQPRGVTRKRVVPTSDPRRG